MVRTQIWEGPNGLDFSISPDAKYYSDNSWTLEDEGYEKESSTKIQGHEPWIELEKWNLEDEGDEEDEWLEQIVYYHVRPDED